MKSGPLYDRPVYHIEMQSVKKMFSGPFGGKVPHKVLIKLAAVFALPLDAVLARVLGLHFCQAIFTFLLFALELTSGAGSIAFFHPFTRNVC